LTIWHCIFSAELTKTHPFRLFFLAILPTGIKHNAARTNLMHIVEVASGCHLCPTNKLDPVDKNHIHGQESGYGNRCTFRRGTHSEWRSVEPIRLDKSIRRCIVQLVQLMHTWDRQIQLCILGSHQLSLAPVMDCKFRVNKRRAIPHLLDSSNQPDILCNRFWLRMKNNK